MFVSPGGVYLRTDIYHLVCVALCCGDLRVHGVDDLGEEKNEILYLLREGNYG